MAAVDAAAKPAAMETTGSDRGAATAAETAAHGAAAADTTPE